MKRTISCVLLVAALAATAVARETEEESRSAEPSEPSPWVSEGVAHPGSDQIFWVPTWHQARAMARATGRLMIVIGSVGDFRGY